jgi:hypothetical protein
VLQKLESICRDIDTPKTRHDPAEHQ